jgi:hypothetical protein
MPVRVTIEGTVFETDSVAEAIEIHRAIGKGVTGASSVNGKQTRTPDETDMAQEHLDRRFTHPRIATFIDSLNENGQKVIKALADHPDGLDTDELAHAISLPSVSLPPVMRHVRIIATRAELDANRVLRRVQMIVNSKPKSRYKLAEEIIREVKEE